MRVKGFTYGWDAHRGMYKTEESKESIHALASLGCNYTALAFAVYQDTFSSTHFGFDYKWTVTDREIELAIQRIKAEGMKVCLKPILNCRDGVWRACISFPESGWNQENYWDTWFDCYTAFICHYAEIAEETGCEMLCIGCEMVGTEEQETHWRNLIEQVRNIYHGPIVYNTNHGKELHVTWWDAVDYIGTSAYFPVASMPGDTKEHMLEAWNVQKERLKKISEHYQKQILFMEIGCRSARGCAMMPWDFMHPDLPYDEEEQANFYDSCLEAFQAEEWMAGYFWWDWSTNLYPIEQAKENTGFSIYGKKAEQVLSHWYHKM